MTTQKDQENKLSLKNFKIIVGDVIKYVDARAMLEVSGLFYRRFCQQTDLNKNFTIDFSDVKYRGNLVSKFLEICQGQSADLKVSDIYYLLLIAEEWDTPEISHQLSQFLESKVEPNKLLSRFSFYIHSQHDVSTFFVDIIASKFRYIFQSDDFINLPPKYICSIIQNPNCEMPRRDLFDKLIVDIIKKHKARCSSLVKYMDLLNTDINNLIELHGELSKDKILLSMYPNVGRILQLRQFENENILLRSQISDLNKENAILREEIKILNNNDNHK